MAEQNKSNKGATNTAVDAIDESNILTELERIGARAGRPTAQRAQLEQRIAGEGKLLNKLYAEAEKSPIIRESPFFAEQETGLRENIRNIRTKMNSMESASKARAESEASTFIARQFGQPALNAQVGSMQKEAAVQNRAFSMAGQSYDELQARREEIFASIRTTERGALNEVKGMFGKGGQVDPEKSAALGAMMSGTQDRLKELATIGAAQQLQRVQGDDPTSRLRKTAEMGQEAQKILTAEGIAQEIKSGGVNITQGGQQRTVANADINKEILDQSRQLADALKELADGVNKTDEELAKLRTNAEESAENLEKLKSAQGMGGGGGITGSQWASAAAGGFNAVGAAVQQIAVSQRLGQVANISGYAGIENQKYDMYKAGRAGDVMSQLLAPQFGEAEDFGRELKLGQQVAVGAYTAGGVAQTAAGGFQVAEGLAQKANPLAYATGSSTQNTAAALQGAQNVVQGLSTTAVNGMDLARGVSTNAAAIQGTQAQMEARRQLLRVQAEQLQGFRDFSVGMGVAAQGMGGRGAAFVEQNTSTESLSRMAEARISPEQMAQLSQMGVREMGSQFNANQIFAARGAERAGFGTMAENMQRMATLAQAGSNNPQAGLASVMEAAFTKGLDSSRALNIVAENTGSLVESSQSRAMGLDSTGAAAVIATAAINKNDPNQEFAARRGMQVQELVSQIGTDQGVNFAAMAATARINKMTGLSGTQAIIAQGLSDTDLRAMREEKDQTKVAESLRMRGINVQGGEDATRLVRQLTEARLMTTLTGGATGIATGASQHADRFAAEIAKDPSAVERLIEARRTGKYESKEQEQFLNGAAEAAGLQKVGLDEYLRGAAGIVTKTDPNAKAKTDDALAGKQTNETLKTIDDLRTSGFKQMSEAAKQATVQFGNAATALKKLGELSANLEKIGATGGEAKFATAAADAAESFGKHTFSFGEHVKTFGDAIKVMNSRAGLGAEDANVRRQADALLDKAQSAMDVKKGRGN